MPADQGGGVTMNVRELRDMLNDCDGDLNVYFPDYSYHGGLINVTTVEVTDLVHFHTSVHTVDDAKHMNQEMITGYGVGVVLGDEV